MNIRRCPACKAILPTKGKNEFCIGTACEREWKAQTSIFSIPGVGVELPHPLQPVSKVVVLPLVEMEAERDILIFDTESLCPIAKDGEPKLPGIKYASGWKEYREMGISVICAYSMRTGESYCYGGSEKELAEFQTLANSHKCIAGYNTLYFDNPLLEHHGVVFDPSIEQYDLLAAIYESAGARIHKCKLDNVAEINLGMKKLGDGALAPIEWQRGNYAYVIRYCLRDAWLVVKLLEAVIATGELVDPRGRKDKLQIRRPLCQPLKGASDDEW